MTYVAAAVAVIAFVVAFERFEIIRIAQRARAGALRATVALRDGMLEDDEKERTVRQASMALARDVLSIITRSAATIVAALVPLVVLDVAGFAPLDTVLAWLGTWEAILLISIAVTAWTLIRRLT